MKKRKITYSLTARQKKNLKRGNNAYKDEKVEEKVDETEKAEMAKKSTRNTIIICVVAMVLAVLMILLAVFIPIWTSVEKVTNDTFYSWRNYNPLDPENLYTDENPNPNPPANPIATITLTGNDKEEFKKVFGKEEVDISLEIFIDDAPYSSMNFLYLAESDFYDDTIIHDIHRGHAMFSGFTDAKNNANRALDRNFIVNLTGFDKHNISTWGDDKFKLGYRLERESKRSQVNSPTDSFGYLIMMASNSYSYGTSNTFMIVTNDNPQFNFGDDNSSIVNYISWLGRVRSDSMEILRKMDSRVINTKTSGNFHVPEITIKIKDIKTDLSKARKNYLLNNFEQLITGAKQGASSSTSWNGDAYNSKNYYNFAE